MKKILATVLAIALMSTPMAYASGGGHSTQVTATGNASESFTVTVPASMSPGDTKNVTVRGQWATDKQLVVTADKEVTLINSIELNEFIRLKVTLDNFKVMGDNKSSITESSYVSVESHEAKFGTWTGTFNYNVQFEELVNPIFGAVYSADNINMNGATDTLNMVFSRDTIIIEHSDNVMTIDSNLIDYMGNTIILWEDSTKTEVLYNLEVSLDRRTVTVAVGDEDITLNIVETVTPVYGEAYFNEDLGFGIVIYEDGAMAVSNGTVFTLYGSGTLVSNNYGLTIGSYNVIGTGAYAVTPDKNYLVVTVENKFMFGDINPVFKLDESMIDSSSVIYTNDMLFTDGGSILATYKFISDTAQQLGDAKDHIVIPDGVAVIYEHAFEYALNMKTLYIPSSVHTIQDRAFGEIRMDQTVNLGYVSDIYYEGTEEQWLSIDGYNNVPPNAEIHYNCTND